MNANDKLAELINQAIDTYATMPLVNGCRPELKYFLADYLLANGVIVPPCKVGDTVYRIVKLLNGETEIVEGEVFEIEITHEYYEENGYRFYFLPKCEEFVRRHYSKWCCFIDFGKTVFHSRKLAEEALNEQEKL